VRGLVRFWWTFEDPVSRRAYLLHGLGLTALKYAGDVGFVAIGAGRLWTPVDYLRAVPFLLDTRLEGGAPWLMPALALWVLPFLWAGVTLTMRRAIDAGWSAWVVLLFFVPLVSYLLMAALAAAPHSPAGPVDTRPPRRDEHRLPGALLAMAAGAAFGLAMILFAVSLLEHYGLGLFLGTPFVTGALTGFFFNRRYAASAGETAAVTAMTFLLLAGTAFLLGTEGAICLLMAAPLGIAIGVMGAWCGRHAALRSRDTFASSMVACLVLPLLAGLEPAGIAGSSVHEVRSRIEIDAAPERVWDLVIAFPAIAQRPGTLFRLGIAYPRSARIEGQGVGATRYCEFSTGAFVEPITAWEPARRLSFDVVASPAPLEELTFRGGVAPAHLDGYLRPLRGEFRLIALPGGGTRLEGSTWYRLRMAPEAYWAAVTDYLIGRIHHRVLDHIRREVERGS